MRLNKETNMINNENRFESAAAWLTLGIDLESRRIDLIGEVCEMMEAIVVRSLLKMSDINKEPIEIYLSTYGGDAYSGLAIYEAIRQCECDVTIIAKGKIMSAGTIIFLAGDYRIAAPSTRFMVHSVQLTPPEGSLKTVEIDVGEAKFINNEMIRIYAERTKMKNPKYWQKKLSVPAVYFSLVEAKELGFIKEGLKIVKKNLTPVKKPAKIKTAKGSKKNVKKK